jgi:rhodanese-related sulfurtransferase
MNDGDASNDPFILSVRRPEHYELGHVPGAVNIPWTQIAKPESLAQLPTDKPIVDYCYTGHTGQVAMTALNLMGYDATNMKFGMMAWTKNEDVLATARFDPAAVPDYGVETEPNEATETYDFPALDTGATGDDEIVRTALDNYLSSGKAPVISAQALFENLNDGDESNDPVILSVRSPDHYAIGHIPGAINIPWTQLGDAENLAKLPPDKPIVVYCYTGHTGQVATTLLSALGYDATNLKFGMMGWSKDADVVATTVFDPATQADYRMEGTLAEASAEVAAPAEGATGDEAPQTLPVSGGILDFTWIYLLMGSGLLGGGVYLMRRK